MKKQQKEYKNRDHIACNLSLLQVYRECYRSHGAKTNRGDAFDRVLLTAFARFSNENISNNAFVDFIRLVGHIHTFFLSKLVFLVSLFERHLRVVWCSYTRVIERVGHKPSSSTIVENDTQPTSRGVSTWNFRVQAEIFYLFPCAFPRFRVPSLSYGKVNRQSSEGVRSKGVSTITADSSPKKAERREKKNTPEANFLSRHILFFPH